MAAVVLNLQRARAERSASAPVIVDQNGQEHPVGGVPLDLFLEIIELQQDFANRETAGFDLASVLTMASRCRAAILAAMPGFPVDGLTFEELMEIIGAMQSATGPAGASEPESNGSSAEPGELTPG